MYHSEGNKTKTMKQVGYIIGYYLKSVHWKGQRQKTTSDHAEFYMKNKIKN